MNFETVIENNIKELPAQYEQCIVMYTKTIFLGENIFSVKLKSYVLYFSE